MFNHFPNGEVKGFRVGKREIFMSCQRVVWSGAAALCAVAVLTSCGTPEERNYSIPKSLCGVRMDTKLIAPFLPAGEKIKVRPVSIAEGIDRCKLTVDGREVFEVSQQWWSKGTPPENVADLNPGMRSDIKDSPGGALYTSSGAVASVDCEKPRKLEDNLFAEVQVRDHGKPDGDAMAQFIEVYRKAVSKSSQCAG